MSGYRCFFYGADSHIKERIDFEVGTDELAIIEARARYAESEYRDGFELWQQTRLVYQEDRLRQRPKACAIQPLSG